MASRRRRRKSIGKVITSVERRMRKVEKRPGPTRLKNNVVTREKIGYRAVRTKNIGVNNVVTENIAPDSVTPIEASFGVNIVSTTEPDPEYLKAGTQWTNPDTSETQVYDSENESFVPVGGADLIARQTADGKNTIYVQNDAPVPSATVVLKENDLWYDTNDGNKLYVWNTIEWANIQDTAIADAKSAATAATVTANGKNRIIRSTLDATGTADALGVAYKSGDLWWKMATTSAASEVLGQWTYSGTAWLSNTIANAVIGNLDAAKITTGYLAASLIQADSISVDSLKAGTLRSGTIYTGSIAASQITAGTITAAISMSAPTITGGSVSGATISLTGSQSVITNDNTGAWSSSGDTSNKLNFTGANYSVIPSGETSTYEVSSETYDPVTDTYSITTTSETTFSNTIKITDTTEQGRIPTTDFYYGELYLDSGSSAGGATLWANYNGGAIRFEVRASDTEKAFYIIGDGTNWTNEHLNASNPQVDQPAYLQADSSGKITRGRTIFTTGSSSTTIASSWSSVGQNGDLAFSTNN